MQVCVGPSKSEEEDSRFRFILTSTVFSFAVFTIAHGTLLFDFNTRKREPENLRLLNEVICSLIFVGLMNIFLLISSKYSTLESDRSKIQIYKQMRKDLQDFVGADPTDTMHILDLFKSEPIPEEKEEKRLFNFLFSKGEAEYLDRDPLDVLELWNVKVEKAETLLTKAAKIKKDEGKVLNKLIEKIENLDINQANSSGRTLLACAIEEGNVPAVEIILSHPEVDVNRLAKYTYKKTQGMFAPLHLAILKENPEIVKLLLGCKDIDVNMVPNCVYRRGKFTALTKAIHLKNGEIVKLLLSHPNIDVNKADPSGWTPLRQACNRGDANQHVDMLGCFRRTEDWPILSLLLRRKDLRRNGYFGWDESSTKQLALKNRLKFERNAMDDVEQMEEEVKFLLTQHNPGGFYAAFDELA